MEKVLKIFLKTFLIFMIYKKNLIPNFNIFQNWLQKFKNPEDFKILDSNNINAKKENGSGNNIQSSRNSSKNSNRTGSSLWGKARAKLGIPTKPSTYVIILKWC